MHDDETKECTLACRPDPTFNQAPTGHKIPLGRSKDDPAMAFRVPDCGVDLVTGDTLEEGQNAPFMHHIGK